MTTRIVIAAVFMLATTTVPAAAQSVSGLSVKRRAAPQDETRIDALDLRRLEAERDRLQKQIEDTTDPAARKGLHARLRAVQAEIRALSEEPVSLAVPAGATAAVGEDQAAAAGPVFGFQAWRPDDFFAGAFFTFDTAATLNGDARKAGEFVRNPPASGTAFYAAASKMFWSFNRTTAPRRWSRARTHDGKQLAFVGAAVRIGVTSATLERAEGEDVISRDAFVFHITPSMLLTSRTFRGENNGEYQFGMEFGLTARWIGGDAAQDRPFLAHRDVLGHDDTRFVGFDGTLFVRMNAFQPFVRITRFAKRDGAHVRGLTGGQAFFGVNVLSALFQTPSEERQR